MLFKIHSTPASTGRCWKPSLLQLFQWLFSSSILHQEKWEITEHQRLRSRVQGCENKKIVIKIKTRIFIARKIYFRVTGRIVFTAQRLTSKIKSQINSLVYTKVRSLHTCTYHDSFFIKRYLKYESNTLLSKTRDRSWPWVMTIFCWKPFHVLVPCRDK